MFLFEEVIVAYTVGNVTLTLRASPSLNDHFDYSYMYPQMN